MKDVLTSKGFSGTVHFSAEDNVFFGKLVGIDDLVTFEGKSVEELNSSFHDAVEDYLAICQQEGKSPYKSYKGTFNVRIKPDIHRLAAIKSIEMGLSLNQFVEQAISDKLSGHSTVRNE